MIAEQVIRFRPAEHFRPLLRAPVVKMHLIAGNRPQPTSKGRLRQVVSKAVDTAGNGGKYLLGYVGCVAGLEVAPACPTIDEWRIQPGESSPSICVTLSNSLEKTHRS
jgi:hypothetical protein